VFGAEAFDDRRGNMAATETTAMQAVEKMYDCFNRGDLDTIKNEVFAPDLKWTLPGRHPLGGTKNGADEVLAFFHELNKSGVQVDLINIAQWTEDTVVEVHRGYGTVQVGEDTVKLDAINCTHYKVVDGKIAVVQVFMGDQYGADNFFWAATKLKPIPDRVAD
jgi:ketosteroid isomerase-like protein